MKSARIIITVSAIAIAIGAAIPTIALLKNNELPKTTISAKSEKKAETSVAETAALPIETTAATNMMTTPASQTTTTVAATTVQPKYQYENSGLTVAKVTEAVITNVQAVTQTTVQTTVVPKTEEKAVTEATLLKAEQPAQAENPAPAAPSAQVNSDSTTVTYRGKEYDKSLTVLDLSGKKMTEADLPELKEAAAQFTNLQKIVLCDCGLSNEILDNLQNEIGIRVVWRVKLGTQWSLRTDAVAFSVLIMNYKHIRMTSADLEVLKYCPDLLALDLGHQALTDLSKIAEYLPELRLLIIADNQVSDLSPLANLKHLHYLEIFVNRVTDLSPLASLRELVDVNISYNPISDITPLLNSPMMQRVWLESTRVSADGVNLLRETYPEAKIVNIGEGSVDQGWRWGNARYEQMMNMWYNNYYGSEFQKYDDLAVTLGLRG